MSDEAKRIVAVVHRRAGKSTALLWRGIKRCLTEKKPRPRVVHILPYGVMWARTGLWDQLAEAVRDIPGAEVRKASMSIAFANGGVFQCGGADNQDSWRGSYADECSIDEYDDTPVSMVPLVIEPMLADRDGVLVRSGTPKGRGLLQAAYDRARTTPGYSSYLLDYTKTGALPDTAIQRLRQEMSDEEFAQELMCSFESPNSGSYYGRMMQEAEDEGRICLVPHEPTLRVWTSWDLGIDDSTAVWFLQTTRAGEWRLIDYLEGSGESLEYYVRLLQQRGYTYERHLLPHDAEVRELGSGRTRTETLHGLGVKPTRLVRQHNVADGIQAVRAVLPRCWFDAQRCALGIRALRNYRREWNESAQTWRSSPVHDQFSHCFSGETNVLTRYGACQIRNLPQSGEVLTPCGWRLYHSPRITRRNALLVEVRFTDGLTVRCTPDHLFWTGKGWTSASDLHPTLPILSSLTLSRSISMASSIAFGRARDILRSAASELIEWYGRQHSAKYQRAVTSITAMAIRAITPSLIWSVYRGQNTCPASGIAYAAIRVPDNPMAHLRSISPPPHERPPEHGISRRREGYGTGEMRRPPKDGKSGTGLLSRVKSVATSFLLPWSVAGGIHRNIAPRFARRGLFASVVLLSETTDVWCLTVPDNASFSLNNGAVVHNCADSMRYMALGVRDGERRPLAEPQWTSQYETTAQPGGMVSTNWMAS